MGSASDELASPPWGSFPVERYLLEHWDEASDEDRVHQYQRLIRNFLQSGEIVNESGEELRHQPEGLERVPINGNLIDSVLKPWRSEQLRKIAGAIMKQRNDDVVILRTHYSGNEEDDETLRAFVEEDMDFDPDSQEEDHWWRVLDDGSCFDFGDDWERVYDMLPELTTRGIGLKNYLVPQTFKDAADAWNDEERHPQEYLQFYACFGSYPLAVADEEFFSTSRPKFVWIDANGNAVRTTRVDAEALGYFRIKLFRGSSHDWEEWQDAEVSEKYKPDGEIGKLLYGRLVAAGES